MHITLESDYAVRIVSCLAKNGGRMILRKLVTGGLVNSYKGTKGGYELGRSPSEISLCDVIEMVEGPYSLARCVSESDYQCNRNTEACGVCNFRKVYAEISETVRQRLSEVKFSGL